MSDIEHLLKKIARLPIGATIEVYDNPGMNKRTREGKYLKIQSGLSTSHYFVGKDLTRDNQEIVVELVG